MRYTIPAICVVILSLPIFALGAGVPNAQEEERSAHVTVKNPAKLSHEEAEKIYDELREQLSTRYAVSNEKTVADYQSWKRYNKAPYLSATHGQRYINSYANALGKDYGTLEAGKVYPEGTVFAKDSITITEAGSVFPGALFGMEKLGPGNDAAFADWRYFMILPDGTMFADSTGDDREGAVYCHVCHQGVAEDDYVFFVPGRHQAENAASQ